MRALLAVAAALSLSCGPQVITNPQCCSPTRIPPGFGFTGSYTMDGGSTQVQLIVGADGVATITFLRGGDQVVQTFQTSGR